MHNKLLSIKEDLLATSQQAKIKRMLNVLLQIDHGDRQPGGQWQIRLEAKLDCGMTESELLETE